MEQEPYELQKFKEQQEKYRKADAVYEKPVIREIKFRPDEIEGHGISKENE